MWAKILLLFFVFSFAFRIDLSFNQDLGRHIKLGEIITKSLSIPETNLFSYTNPDFAFINTHWLFGVIAYIFSQFNALPLFLILKILILLVSVWLVIKIIPEKNQILLLPIGYIFLHILRERLELRPEIFSFLFTTLTLFILNKFLREKTRLIYLLPIIQVFWINTHIYFFVGLILQAIFLIQAGYQHLRLHPKGVKLKILALILILSVFISLLNPNGTEGLFYPLNVTQNYGYTIAENQNMALLENIQFKNPNFIFVKLAVVITIIGIIFSFLRKNAELKNLLIGVFGVALALLNIRSFPYLVFLSLPAVLISFGEIKRNSFTSFLFIVSCFLIILESFFYLNGSYYRLNDLPYKTGFGFEENVKKAMDFVVQNKLPAPIYNNFDIGSYIIYKGYPAYQVFVDGRPEAYPKQFFSEEYIPPQSDYKKFKELENKYQFKTIIFSHTDQTPWGKAFLQNIIKDSDWSLVFIDDFMLVFVRPNLIEKNKLSKVELSKILPNEFDFDNHFSYLRLGVFLISNGFVENGGLFIEKAKQISPQSPFANSILGNPMTSKFFW